MGGPVNISRWECDRCQRVEEISYGTQPDEWVRLLIVRPPAASIADKNQHVGLYCGPCFGQIKDVTERTGAAYPAFVMEAVYDLIRLGTPTSLTGEVVGAIGRLRDAVADYSGETLAGTWLPGRPGPHVP